MVSSLRLELGEYSILVNGYTLCYHYSTDFILQHVSVPFGSR